MTIKDIAKIAGVHLSTVSRSLNDSPLVAQKTKERIKKIAQENGFEFNANARGLVTSRVGTIAIILPPHFEEVYVSFFHNALHNHLRTTLEREDFDLIVAFLYNRFTQENNIKKLVTRKKIDGVIIVQPDVDPSTLTFMKERRVPYVFSHYPPLPSTQNEDVVYTDHEAGGYLVGKALLERGLHKAACIRPIFQDAEYELRLQGFKKALAEGGVTLSSEKIWRTSAIHSGGGYDIIMEKRQELWNLQVLFCLTDLIALGVMDACRVLKKSIPEDIAVIGYDDSPLSQYMHPALTTVHQPTEEIAALTCERLIAQIRAKEEKGEWKTERIRRKPTLILRDTFR